MQRLLSNAAQQPVVRRVGSREGGREGREGEEEGYVHMNCLAGVAEVDV